MQIKLAHEPQVALIEPLPELSRERLCQARDQLFAILRAFGASLLELDDMASDLPIGAHLHGIDGPQRLLARGLDQRAHLPQQGIERRR